MIRHHAPGSTRPLTRRELRAQRHAAAHVATAEASAPSDPVASLDLASEASAPTEVPDVLVRWADEHSPATALSWVDVAELADSPPAAPHFSADDPEPPGPDLLDGCPRRTPLRPSILIPAAAVLALLGGYSASTLLWPLHEVAPTVEAVAFQTVSADPATVTWPSHGAAAVGVQGLGVLASTDDVQPMASITKVVSSLMVLDRRPISPGEQGETFTFTWDDAIAYWDYLGAGESALDMPAGAQMTEYQLLQGTLIRSANNYINYLADDIWGSDSTFEAAAREWLDARGLSNTTVVEPSGIEWENVATPAELIRLGEIAMSNPVISEIVGTTGLELPGAGWIDNSNRLLIDDPDVVGIKTGTLEDWWNVLAAKDITVGDTTIRVFAVVLGQSDNDERFDVARSLFADVEAALGTQGPVVPAGTVVGRVTTEWGATSDIVSTRDARVVLWNGASAQPTVHFALGERRDAGDVVGELAVAGPVDGDETPVALTDDVEGPGIWWRLTNPMKLWGLND